MAPLNIIYTPNKDPFKDRWQNLSKELASQNITDFKIWPGIIDPVMPFRGVSKAHKQIVRWAKEQQLPEVIIAEDDIKFTCSRSYQYFLDNRPADFDIYLSSVYTGTILPDQSLLHFCGMTLYIVRAKFYDTFLSVSENNHIDGALTNSGRFIVCNPFVAIQHNGWSLQKNLHMVYDETSKYMKGRTFLV